MKFCDLLGQEVSREEFVKNYERNYFITSHDQPIPERFRVKGIRKSSCFIEQKIEAILECGIKSESDVLLILAWKIGKIDHNMSEKQQKIRLLGGWEKAEKYLDGEVPKDLILQAYHEIQIGKVAAFVVNHFIKKEVKIKNNDDAQQVLDKMKNAGDSVFAGIGPVYCLTLLYFLSKGAYPIYDKFVMTALEAICNGDLPSNEKNTKTEKRILALPDRKSSGFNRIINESTSSYQLLYRRLKELFQEEFNKRNVDRALWVYGHCYLPR